jgi:hypothetical protein
MENLESKPDLVKDFFRELKEKEEIWKMPMNGLSKLALANVKKSEISLRIEKRYVGIGLSEFLNITGKQ